MNTSYFRRLLTVGLLALTVSSVRADEEQDLINTLKSIAGPPQKCAACQRLRVVGTGKSVPALAELLGQEGTAQAARYALEGLPFPEAGTALRKALGTTSGSIQAGLVDSVGWRRDAAAVPLLKPMLTGADTTLASAAASALGRIGGKRAVSALTAARNKAAPSVQPAILEALLKSAELFLAEGDAKSALLIYRDMSAPTVPERIRMAAWRGLVMADPGSRAELVATALASRERPLHMVALKVIRELNDAAVVEACVRQWPALPADSQVAVLEARLTLGGDKLAVVRHAAQSPHLSVRLAAWQALADLGDASSIPALSRAAAQGEPAEREAARNALARVRGPGIRDALLARLADAQAAEKVELLRVLGERADAASADVLLQNAAAGPEPARLAALDSLRKLAVVKTAAPLLERAAQAKSEAECELALKALYAVCQASGDKGQTTRVILETMRRLPPTESRRVMPVLAELATPAALEAVQAVTREQDSEAVKEAVRVLSQWPSAAPAGRLLELASTAPEPVLQVLALRGCIQVAGQEPDPARRLALLQQAMTTAKRPEEKKQALGQIGQVPTAQALQSALSYMADADLANEAGLAAVTIAEKLAVSDPKLAQDTAAKVLAQCKTPDIVKRAWAIRGKPTGAGPFIQDWLVCGPYKKAGLTGAQAVFDVVFAPEKPGEAVQWKALPRGKIANLLSVFPDQASCVAYLKTRVIAPKDCDAALLLGSDDGLKAWLNGAVVHSNNVDRGLSEDQDMAPIHLTKGANELLLKVTQGGGGWAACARIVNSDGAPIKGLKVQVDR